MGVSGGKSLKVVSSWLARAPHAEACGARKKTLVARRQAKIAVNHLRTVRGNI